MHCVRKIALLSILLLISPSIVVSSDPPAVAPKDLLHVIRADDEETAKAAAARLLAAAEAGNSFAMYDIGSLHRQPKRKSAIVFPYDPGKAIYWLTRAFDHGRLAAAYKLALIHADLDEDLDAMGWAQVYSHYLRSAEEVRRAKDRGYDRNQLRLALLNDLYARIGRDREAEIRERLIALLEQHGPKFEAARKLRMPRHPDWLTDHKQCSFTTFDGVLRAQVRSNGFSLIEFLIEIDRQGRPSDIAALDSAPIAMFEHDFRPLIHHLDCAPQPGTRYTFRNLEIVTGPKLRLLDDPQTN